MSKNKSKSNWIDSHLKDKYVKLANKENLKSRASFKLKQINEKYKVLKKGDSVIDLGAAPGGWTQIAKSIVGESGFILAIDLLPITGISGVSIILGDIFSDDVLQKNDELLKESGIEKVALVMSDMAPNLTGIQSTDSTRSYELNRRALFYAKKYVKKGGSFIVKLFRNEYYKDLFDEILKDFSVCNVYKPDASRSKSSEIYFIAVGKK